MKADESRSPLPLKHKLDHAVPTVIHHPEDEMPLLRRWFHRAMEHPTRFWTLVAAVAVVVLGLSVLSSGLTIGKATSDAAWTRLETAKTPGDRVEIAKEFPNTPAERWAKLQAATEYYNQGFNDLPANREAALAALRKALDLFEQVARDAPAETPQARAAALGVARTLEARNDLDKAVAQYEKVAGTRTWAGTEEARTAARLAAALKTPEARSFYKDLYAFRSPEATLAPGGIGNIPIPLPDSHPPLNGPTVPTPTSPFAVPGAAATPSAGNAAEPNPLEVPPPPPSPAPRPATKGAAAPGAESLPLELFNPNRPATATPKAEPPKVEPPKVEPPKGAGSGSGLPADVFSPPAGETPGGK